MIYIGIILLISALVFLIHFIIDFINDGFEVYHILMIFIVAIFVALGIYTINNANMYVNKLHSDIQMFEQYQNQLTLKQFEMDNKFNFLYKNSIVKDAEYNDYIYLDFSKVKDTTVWSSSLFTTNFIYIWKSEKLEEN